MMTTTATKERLVPVSVKPDVEAIRVLEQTNIVSHPHPLYLIDPGT